MGWTHDAVMDKSRELFELARRVAAHREADGRRPEFPTTVYTFGPRAGQVQPVAREVLALLGQGSMKEVIPALLRTANATHALWIAEAWVQSNDARREALMGIVTGPRLEVHLRAMLGDAGAFETPEEYRVPVEGPALGRRP